jgi:very-short-patch-repair endonuclease
MAHDVPAIIGPDGWISREALTSRVDRKTVGRWTAAKKLVRLERGLYAAPAGLDWRVRVEAAVRSRNGVASHSTALALWELIPPPAGPVHVTVTKGLSGRSSPGVLVHRSGEVEDVIRRVEWTPVTCVERAVVDAWGQPGGVGRAAVRAAAITAVRRRLCRPADLATELARRPQLPARASLAELIRLLQEGCRSELEVWGVTHVLRGPGMPPFTLQRRVVVRGETFFLDAACEEVMLAVELDGAAWHGSKQQRERDIRRDALVATIGWQTLRFAYWPMVRTPDRCRGDILAAYEARRRLIRGGRVQ